MKIRLGQVADKPFDWHETLELTGGELGRSEVVDLSAIKCRGQIRPVIPGYLLQASLAYRQVLCCMRCLEPYEMPVTSLVSLMIQIQEPETTHQPQELELTEDDVGVLFLQEPELETRSLVIEHVHLGVPMKPLCSEGCRGLCASCGKNLNTETCECRPSSDPRWDALRGFHPNKTKV